MTATTSAMDGFDLLLRGGRVIDPAQGIDGQFDVAITGGRVAQVAPGLPASAAREVIDCSGALVLPGLIDLHVHCYRFITDFGLPADDTGIDAGVTTVVDQGSAGCWTLEGFRAYVAQPARTEVLSFISINLSGTLRGARGGPVIQNPDYIDVDMLVRFAERFPELIRGVKAHGEAGSFSHWGTRMLDRAREAGDRSGLPLYVHTGQLWPVHEPNRPDADFVLEEVLARVRPGDTLAHAYSAKDDGILGRRPRPDPKLVEAVRSGVHLDIGHGVNFSFDTARRMMDAGLLPYTVSSDVHGDFYSHDNDTTLDYSLMGTMSKLLALGIDLHTIVRGVTLHPATVLRMGEEIGTLVPGSRADVSVLDLVEAPWTFSDCHGERLAARQRFVPRRVVREGRSHVPTCRLLRDVMPAGEVATA
jgi:dihydroorotase